MFRGMQQNDEIWTEEEVMEFGLAGEEEFCDFDTVEPGMDFEDNVEMQIELETEPEPEIPQAVSPIYIMQDNNVTKSGRVRKKSAKLMEMEETDHLDMMHASSTRSRRGRPSGSFMEADQIPFQFDESLSDSEKSAQLEFSNDDSYVELPPAKNRSKKDKRKSKSSREEIQPAVFETGEEDVPRAKSPLVLRMKLNMAQTSLVGNSAESIQEGSKKSPRKKAQSDIIPPLFTIPMTDDELANADGVLSPVSGTSRVAVVSEDSIGSLGRQRRYKKKTHAEDEGNSENVNTPLVLKFASMEKPTQKPLKPTRKQKKKRQKGYTAYMLWCSTQRNRLTEVNPGIDFATLSKSLGEMWHTVPEKEKMQWRRKARKLARKGSSLISTGKVSEFGPRRGRPPGSYSGRGRPPSLITRYQGQSPDETSSAHFKVTGTGPLESAAHLKLLGESLTVIGARLMEHKGQIAVQGSLSVLLDSMLCALAPLMCLTTRVPELNGCDEQIHANTLNNIAYIMPGVG